MTSHKLNGMQHVDSSKVCLCVTLHIAYVAGNKSLPDCLRRS